MCLIVISPCTGPTSDTPFASPEVHSAGVGLAWRAEERSGTGATPAGSGWLGNAAVPARLHTEGLGGGWLGNAAVPARLYTPVSPPTPETSTDAGGRRKFAQCAASRQYKQEGEISAKY